MLLSVFTPSHDPRWLDDAYRSLLEQDAPWEWVVLLNGPAEDWACDDTRVRVIRTSTGPSVGALKAEAVTHCRGDVLVELDHDDLLLPRALSAVAAAVERHPDVGLVYSDTIQVGDQLGNACPDYPTAHGWTYATAYALGAAHRYAVSPPPTPHNVSLIWYAPNHLRAFTRTAYDAVGGYSDLAVLDDQELMARLYQHGPFIKAGGPLYVQRVHGHNTQSDPDTNAAIQRDTVTLYDQHLEGAALARATRAGLLALDLGAAHAPAWGFTAVDQHPTPGGIQHTFPDRLDLPDGSVGVIRAHDFLEHVADKVTLWNELHRLLAPGGLLLTHTPSTDGRGAWQDPTHVAGYNANSLWYWTDPAYAAYVPESTARFQVGRARTWHPTPWHEQHLIPYVTASLIAVHPGMERSYGPLLW